MIGRHSLFAFALLVPACATSPDIADGDTEDGEHDTADGKADSVLEGTEAAAAILSLVNDPLVTEEQLDIDGGFSQRVSRNIVNRRAEGVIHDLKELDAIPYVGPATIAKLGRYATTVLADAPGHTPVGPITEDAIWSPSQGLIEPAGYGVEIAAGTTVRITAGTRVETGAAGLIVHGTLVIDGVRSAPVTLHSKLDGLWGGIRVMPGGRVVLDHTAIHQAGPAVTLETGAEEATVRSLTIDDFVYTGVLLRENTRATFDGLNVKGGVTATALEVSAGASATVRNYLTRIASTSFHNAGTLDIENATLTSGGYSTTETSQTTVRNSIFSNGWIGTPNGDIAFDNVLIHAMQYEHNLPPGDITAVADPGFVADGSYQLRADSPAVDAGTSGPSHDLAGRKRDARPDLGAYELAR